MAGLPAGTIGVEYTRGGGSFFPSSSSIATSTESSTNSGTTSSSTGVGTAFPSSPVTGQTFYRTDTSHLYVWTGSAWQVT